MSSASRQQPNVLCIVADQHRHDHLGCAGNPIIQTPNIDRLAHCGVRYERCYVNNPVCKPSRATMWTGQSVHSLICITPITHRNPTSACTTQGICQYQRFGQENWMYLPSFYNRIQSEAIRVGSLIGPVSRFYGNTPEIMARTYGMVSNIDANVR